MTQSELRSIMEGVAEILRERDAKIAGQLGELRVRLDILSLTQGPQGADGKPGERGESGPQGPPGRDGERGERGERGPQGERGTDGAVGPQGPQGERGPDGVTGAKGEPGERGDPGLVGPIGLKGADGAPGPQGERGPVGPAGERGEKGIDGTQGPQGLPGERGPQGERGEKGPAGDSGRDGRDAKDGRDGKDAFDINPLPDIDWNRDYPAGQWARHRGGLWRCSGGKDWVCMLDGPFAEETLREGRTVTRRTIYASGKTYDVVHKSTEMQYRDVFKEGERYDRGDTVTYGGGLWVCIVDQSTAVPGRGKDNYDWRLACRAGRDGKDAFVKVEREPEPVRLK